MTEKLPLKPCAFCGAPGFLMLAAYGFKIKCTDTDCTVETPIKTHNHQVAAIWNRRASPDKEQRAGFVMVPVAQVVHEKFKDSLGGQHERRKVVLFKEGLDLPDGTLLAAAPPSSA